MSSVFGVLNPVHRRLWILGSLWTLYASFGLVAGSLAPLLSVSGLTSTCLTHPWEQRWVHGRWCT